VVVGNLVQLTIGRHFLSLVFGLRVLALVYFLCGLLVAGAEVFLLLIVVVVGVEFLGRLRYLAWLL